MLEGIFMEFAQRLEELLKKENITAYRLSKILGVHQTTVKNWLEGTSKPRAEFMEKISEHFNVSIDYLINGTDSSIQASSTQSHAVNEKEDSYPTGTSKEYQISQLSIMLNYAPDEISSCLSVLCRNERIEQDLTERYLANASHIPLEDYLSFESNGKGLLPAQIITVLNALKLNVTKIIGSLKGSVLSYLKNRGISPENFISEIEDNDLMRKAIMLMASADTETLAMISEELERVTSHNDEDYIIIEKIKKAYSTMNSEPYKNRLQKD